MKRFSLLLLLLLLLLLASPVVAVSCSPPELAVLPDGGDAETSDTGVDASAKEGGKDSASSEGGSDSGPDASIANKVDLLFMIDNSPSMGDKESLLAPRTPGSTPPSSSSATTSCAATRCSPSSW